MCYNSRMLALAARISESKQDDRRYRLGAVGLRNDGVLVFAVNGNPKGPTPEHHAEFRLTRKLTKGSIVWVSRVLRSGHISLSRPCPTCMVRLRNVGVSQVYWTVRDSEFSCLTLT